MISHSTRINNCSKIYNSKKVPTKNEANSEDSFHSNTVHMFNFRIHSLCLWSMALSDFER